MFIVSTFCQFFNVNYLLECFLGGSGGMEVDITWILLFARMFLGCVWMSGCGYYVDIIIDYYC